MLGEKDKRIFAPFPIEMDEHPKIIGLSDAAFRAVFEGTFYSRRMLTDGFLDERVVLRRWGQEVADELSSNDPEKPTWVRVERGWQIHDFHKHHPLRAEIEAKSADLSEKRAQAGRIGAAKRWQKDGKGMASDSSESESESETRLPIETSSVSQERNAREATDSEETIRGSKTLAATLGVDLDAVIKMSARLERNIGYGDALRLGSFILAKAKRHPSKPMAYIATAFQKNPLEVQQWIDREVKL